VSEYLALCILAFFAGLIDAIAGGGGLIQVPALFAVFPTLPPPLLLGTNKFSALTGTTIATLRYSWSVPIRWRVVLPAAGIAGIGALLGAKAVTLIDTSILRPLLLILLFGTNDTGFQHYDVGMVASYSINHLFNFSTRYGSFNIEGYLFYTDNLDDNLIADNQVWGGVGLALKY